jgi:hypothetical protein
MHFTFKFYNSCNIVIEKDKILVFGQTKWLLLHVSVPFHTELAKIFEQKNK